ncbi:MAG: hypothetical protein COT33_03210 [Candidatus Nealsonbacteria bacterium CG08_land_8_20_14_0_20_38_20]|uniref:Cell division protein FtsZ n=1 Tax=Candidatus Nealsonbacteria bacterium CG08_land_8_20_14_0_20_38_20 TaxID=1974705 RepID=A0A2H0YL33_9BACT|nr:MAG: hypothetical protein COT33_03210 [Candidatus Nealsonbacteria bacterium CG08_land_8_20_14_0_20_38_20]
MVEEELNFNNSEKIKRIRVKVIGIGGGGGSIVSEIALQLKKTIFLVANTDNSALKRISNKVKLFQFGQNVTSGLGTGMKPEIGEMAAENERERIKKELKEIDLCIFVATLGGGTGSGAAPVFAKLSKNLGNLNYGIFTLPFDFEGKKKMEIAKAALEKLNPNLHAFSIIPNERIFQTIDRGTPLKIALSQINKILVQGLGGLIEIIYEPGLINIDFADVKTIFKSGRKLAFLNSIAARGENRVKEAIENVLNSPLYPYNIQGARGILFNITGDRNLGLSEVEQLSKNIFELGERGAKIIFGISEEKEIKNEIKITLLALGCKSNFFPEETLPDTPRPKAKNKTRNPAAKNKLLKKVNVEEVEEVEKIVKKTDPENLQIRKNALQIKKELEAAEQELLEQEKFWETPAFLRKKIIKG